MCCIYYEKVSVLKLAKEDRVMSKPAVLNLIIMGFPMGLQYSITAIGSMVMQSANNKLGSIYVSGFTAGARIKQFTMCPYDAFATGASVLQAKISVQEISSVSKGYTHWSWRWHDIWSNSRYCTYILRQRAFAYLCE